MIINRLNLHTIFLSNISFRQIVFKNISWLIIAEIMTKIPALFIGVLIARYLGVTGYGLFSFAISYVTLFMIISEFGFSDLTIREVARNKTYLLHYLQNVTFIKLLLSILSFLLIFLTMTFTDKPLEMKILVYLAFVWILFQTFNLFAVSVQTHFITTRTF